MIPDPLLLAAIRAVARSGDPDVTLGELLEIGMRASGADRVAAFLWDADQGALAIAGSRGYPADDMPTLEAAVATADHPVRLAAEERIRATGQPGEGGRVVIAWPIVVGSKGMEEPVGALAFEADQSPDADTSERIAALADLVAIVVDRARLAANAAERVEYAERVANSDALTGLANGRTLQRVLELELARAARQSLEITVALFDVDDLSGFNETNGRAAGDELLREVAAVMSESVRFVDTVARWGADEFLLVAPGAKGTTVVQRIVDAVAARSIGGGRATISAGLARFPADGTTSDELIAAAARALETARTVGPGTLAEVTRDGNGSISGITTGSAGA
ncbi:MAG TPA: sensor domain-containing diguanylate cyclase [Candidatus Binatia bacterium]|nr:sensor domain-containing diguanylate cyclase [Candidatus Binatia bacterium]